MNKLVLLLVSLMSYVEANMYLTMWARKNDIDPDFLHMKAMKSLTKGTRVLQRFHETGYVSAVDSKFSLKSQIIDVQKFFLGFVNGTQNENSSKICGNALAAAADSSINLIDNRFVWMPDYVIKFNQANEEFTDHTSTAYAYCNLD